MPERGIHTVTVPGDVAGWAAIRERFATMPFSTLLSTAIYYAEHGVPVNEITSEHWSHSLELLSEASGAASTFLIDGHSPSFGEIFRNPDLASSLRRIVEHGRDGYYRGHTAESIVSASQALGGAMAVADLAEFQPEWVTPISTTYPLFSSTPNRFAADCMRFQAARRSASVTPFTWLKRAAALRT